MSSSRIDIEVIGSSAVQKHRVAASATRFYVGEPLDYTPTYTAGDSDVNTVTQAADNTPVIGTDVFVGIAAMDAPVGTDTTVDADWVDVTEIIPNFTRMRGKIETAANVDTLTELIGKIYDYARWNLASGTFTIADTKAATSGLMIVGGIWEQSLLDVTVDGRAMRLGVS